MSTRTCSQFFRRASASLLRLGRWLNALPVVSALLARDFDGSPVSKQNLCEWRAGGFAEWQARQETLDQARELAADAEKSRRPRTGD